MIKICYKNVKICEVCNSWLCALSVCENCKNTVICNIMCIILLYYNIKLRYCIEADPGEDLGGLTPWVGDFSLLFIWQLQDLRNILWRLMAWMHRGRFMRLESLNPSQVSYSTPPDTPQYHFTRGFSVARGWGTQLNFSWNSRSAPIVHKTLVKNCLNSHLIL